MPELKGNVNADKLFSLLLKKVKEQGDKIDKKYTIMEIASLIPKEKSGIEKYESYNYSMTSMFSEQKGRDYFIFKNPSLKDIFTDLANNKNRNNRTWKTYGNEMLRINPIYLKQSREVSSYLNVKSIRVLPMSETDPEFTGQSIVDVQEWFMNELPYRDFNFTKGLNAEKGTLVLFQYKAHIIASAILDEKVVFNNKLGGVYRGAYRFIPSSIAVFNPIESMELKNIWKDFAGLNRVQHSLDVNKYIKFDELLVEKQIKFVEDKENEDSFQKAVEKTHLNSPLDDNDEPLDPLGISIGGKSKRWIRNSLTSKKAIVLAKYRCEFNENHLWFKSKFTGQNYVEAHHLIPMEFQGQFKRSLDVKANIVSLCPLCHKTIHHASSEEKKEMIKDLYLKRKHRLQKCEIDIDLNKLISFYQ